ncbi:unnamed protein product [Mesocestoides corti]|uniref:PH domain-containing protein n=1 Tax=Mesocestoides corti TaxID=53468 RepID=A0A0R3U5T8_MESCO|nr:unnamed protein product [Mesocestoides corti]
MGPKRTNCGSETVAKTETNPCCIQSRWERRNFRPQPAEFNLDDDIDTWVEKMEEFLKYEEPETRSRKVMRNLAAPARRIALRTVPSEDVRTILGGVVN